MKKIIACTLLVLISTCAFGGTSNQSTRDRMEQSKKYASQQHYNTYLYNQQDNSYYHPENFEGSSDYVNTDTEIENDNSSYDDGSSDIEVPAFISWIVGIIVILGTITITYSPAWILIGLLILFSRG